MQFCPGVIDCAHWDADPFRDLQPHLAQAKADGVIAVVAKATQGCDAVDTQWSRWVREVRAAGGLLFGAYHFLSSSTTGDVQAQWFLRHIEAEGLDPHEIVLAVDFETNPNPKWQATAENARQFAREIKRVVGRYPLLYGYQSMLCGLVTDPHDELVQCPLWMAAYGSSAAAGPKIPPGYTKAGKGYSLWQYSDGKFSASGLPRDTAGFPRCDRSVYRGTADELRAAWPSFGG